jgi:hypothetical protein
VISTAEGKREKTLDRVDHRAHRAAIQPSIVADRAAMSAIYAKRKLANTVGGSPFPASRSLP